MEGNIFFQISIILGITVSIAFVVRLLHQPLMVAYVMAGIFCGPFFLDLIKGDQEIFDSMAQFGVALLLFMIGLSLDLNHLKKIGKVAAITGLGQVLFTLIIGASILLYLGFSIVSSIFLALAITFSSTIIITKLLADKRDTERIYGRYTIGLMIVQDIIAIAIMIIIGTLKQDSSILSSLWLISLKGFLLIAFLVAISKYLIPKIMKVVSQSSDFLFIFTITWCFGIASIVHWFGFSIEIGAIAAGITLGSSSFQMEIASRVKPLRDFFIILFFIILGSEMVVSDINNILIPGIVLSVFILIGNPLILYVLFRAFKFTRRNSFLAGLTAAQVSEFGFILLFTGHQAGYVGKEEFSIFTFVAITTIFISSYLITYNNQIYKLVSPIFHFFFGKDKQHQRDEKIEPYDVWIFGCHRIGWNACQVLKRKKIKFAVVDLNSSTIEKMRQKNIPAFFGDVADVEFLDTLPLKKAKLIILTAPDPEDQKTFATFVRHFKPRPIVITNLHHYKHADEIYSLGVDYISMPHLLSGQWIAQILQHYPLEKKTLKKFRRQQTRHIGTEF